jgi:PTH1 family peptidyl-tRNA hydrolase
VGLGNPGPDYEQTRHNAGFWFVEKWAETLGVPFRKPWFRPFSFALVRRGDDVLVLVKPLTFMNLSGRAFPSLLARFGAQPQDLLVVFDQMDLPPGRVRMKSNGSHAGHNGLKSIDAFFGNGDYHRLAVGIGRPPAGESIVDHVLGRPPAEDREAIDQAVGRTVTLVDGLWTQGWEAWIRAVNQRERP